jgi:hypothetical protein
VAVPVPLGIAIVMVLKPDPVAAGCHVLAAIEECKTRMEIKEEKPTRCGSRSSCGSSSGSRSRASGSSSGSGCIRWRNSGPRRESEDVDGRP